VLLLLSGSLYLDTDLRNTISLSARKRGRMRMQMRAAIVVVVAGASLLQQMLMLPLPGRLLGTKCVADLVPGGNGRDLFPQVAVALEEPAPAVVDHRHDLLGHTHFFLLAGSGVVLVGKAFQDSLEGLVARVTRANPGLSAEDVPVGGRFDAGFFIGGVVGDPGQKQIRRFFGSVFGDACGCGCSFYFCFCFVVGDSSWQASYRFVLIRHSGFCLYFGGERVRDCVGIHNVGSVDVEKIHIVPLLLLC